MKPSLAMLAGLLTLLGARQALATTRCSTVLTSDRGDRLQLITNMGGHDWAAWSPPATAPALQLTVVYFPPSPADIGPPVGGNAAIRLDAPAPPDAKVLLSDLADGGWKLLTQSLPGSANGRARFLTVGFSSNRNDGGAGDSVLAAIRAGARLKVSVTAGDAVLASETFDLAQTGERDRLLAQARASFEHPAPGVCVEVSDMPPPVVASRDPRAQPH